MEQSYETTRAQFKWDRRERFNFAADVVDGWAARTPNTPAIKVAGPGGAPVERSYTQLAEASRRCASVLSAQGVGRGDVVLLVLTPQPVWWEAVTACLRMGAVVSPGTIQLSAKDIAYRVQSSGAACIIADAANAAKVDEVAAQCPSLKIRVIVGASRPGWVNYANAMETASPDFPRVETASDETAICYFTSGTTGHPKMVLHTQASFGIGHEVTGRFWLDLEPGEVHWNVGDMGWAKAAYSSYFGPFICGATVFAYSEPRFEPRKVLELIQTHSISSVCGAPTIYRMLVQEDLSGFAFPKLRQCLAAGEPLNPEIIAVWQEATGLMIREGYGQTETAILCATFPGVDIRPGSMGKAAPGFDLQVVDEKGSVLAAGEEGQIAVRVKPERPVGLFREYWKSPEKTLESFQGDWYLTGDRAVRDEDGYFWFVSRSDDVILSAGYRIGPFEVESALLEHPAVAESAVVSSPDTTRGEVVKAFIVLAEGHVGNDALVGELQQHVKTTTAPYKYPRRIEFVESLPKTVSGKIRRVELRAKEWASG